MQTVSSEFTTLSQGDIRPISYRLFISFDKDYDNTTSFFTVGTSLVGGPDVIKGTGDVVQEWDKYLYEDYTDRVISLEWSRSQQHIYSVNQAIADVVLNNYDGRFTPSENSSVLPRRPIKIYAGFNGDDIPVFIGLTDGTPRIDKASATATFHCIDFMNFVFNKVLNEAVIYQNTRIDLIIGDLLENFGGLTSTQYDLDEAFNTIPFAFFDGNTTLGSALDKLVQADLGNMFLTENGVIRFANRQNYSEVSVMDLDGSNVNVIDSAPYDSVVNVVTVKSNIRELVENQKIYTSTEPILVSAGTSEIIWPTFQEPVTAIDTPVYVDNSTTSSYSANTSETGAGTPYTDIVLDSYELFSKSYKMVFVNNGTQDAYIRGIQLFGTQAKVTRKIELKEQDEASVDKYEEKIYEINNDYIQDESTARSLALTTIGIHSGQNDNSAFVDNLDIKGTPALQINDPIYLSVPISTSTIRRPVGLLAAITKSSSAVIYQQGDYFITGMDCRIAEGRFKQRLRVRKRDVLTYFTVGVSVVGGPDVIAP